MKSMTALAVVFLGAMVVVMAHAGPTYAQQTTMAVTNAGSAADSVIVAESPVSVQLVRRGGGGHAFRSGGFRGSGFARHHRFRPFLFGGTYGGYGYSDYYAGCGEGCYQEGNKTCVWNGYKYRCYISPDETY